MYVCMYVRMHVCMYVRMYVHMYVCVFVGQVRADPVQFRRSAGWRQDIQLPLGEGT